ncbi:MAG: FeoA domain-containing protein [Proteobacteria bacterium]|nr:FeoA domain-containing protein [Pseudomonadota bacterium]MBU1386409.1 FeoA domain-containing protein [Pseudomonadota bacterium]MBU1544520.1 FeoA domain-containing protein [Pseudomonadota bacterium]MBU2429395.1 FeoA domain-containing protein [Pseudomonadota bacterium]MBU2480114.1 FeoA domain-containing protein [Pseudomonadota bacterium]
MTDTHEQEKKQFKRLFAQQGVDQFDMRLMVLDAFLKLEHHVTIQEIMEQLAQDGNQLSEEFVLNSMELLCRFGFANKNEFDVNKTQYEHRHLGLHHDHMVCTKCGTILEFKDEAIEKQQLKVADAYGFHMLQHKMEIYGICSACMEDRRVLVPLHKARPGEKLIVKDFSAGQNMQSRVSSMGLRIGDTIEVVSSGFGGQVVIAAGENRLVLGKGMAEKISVQPLDPVSILTLEKDQDVEETVDVPIPLKHMKKGQEGIIRKVSGEGVFRRRLLEMGINRGSKIYVEKYAPLKDPIELVIKGFHISLRVEEAANILVENVKYKKR